MDGDIIKFDYLDRQGLSATVEIRIVAKGVSLAARRHTLHGGCHGEYQDPARETAKELDTIGALVVLLDCFNLYLNKDFIHIYLIGLTLD
jgi:hypothetical protein